MALRQSVGELADTLLSTIRTRIELFSLEAADQKARMVRLLALLCVTLFFVPLAVLPLSATIALYFWPTPYRYLALWLMVLLRSEEHTSALQSLMRTSHAFLCLQKQHDNTST